MEYKKFKDLKISNLCLGTVQLGKNYGIANKIGKPSLNNAQSIMQIAFKGGINIFDTAANYGDSEIIIGDFLKSINKDNDIYISSKIPPVPDDLVQYDQVFTFCESIVNQTLNRLGITSLPICLLHSANDLYRIGSILEKALQELKAKGKIQEYGVSIYTKEDVLKFLEYPSFSIIQVPINIFDHKLHTEGFLKKLKHNGKFIMARSVFLQGLFFLDPDETKKKIPHASKYIIELREISDKYQITIDKLALGYLKSIEEIDTILIGSETTEQIETNLKLFETANIPEEVKLMIEKTFRDLPIELINPSKWKI